MPVTDLAVAGDGGEGVAARRPQEDHPRLGRDFALAAFQEQGLGGVAGAVVVEGQGCPVQGNFAIFAQGLGRQAAFGRFAGNGLFQAVGDETGHAGQYCRPGAALRGQGAGGMGSSPENR